MAIRHLQVAVAVVFDQPSESFLLCHNKRWNGYAFPMKHVDSRRGDSPEEVVLRALDDWYVPVKFPDAKAAHLDYLVETLWSDAAREVTVYEYHVFEVNPGMAIPNPLPPDLRLFTYEQQQEAVNVTSSTKAIAQSLVEDRNVAVAVVTRCRAAGREFLLVNNPNHGYFFPSTRIKARGYPPEAAVEAAQSDLGHHGPWEVLAQAPEAPAVKQSVRFGRGECRFHYHLCLLNTPGIDLCAAGNPLETSLSQLTAEAEALAPYWRWATEDELRNDPGMSPSMPAVLLTALQLVEAGRLH